MDRISLWAGPGKLSATNRSTFELNNTGATVKLIAVLAFALYSSTWMTAQQVALNITPPRAEAPVDFRPGPVVWQEEYWDVKPHKLDEFMAAYRAEVYSIARHIHGYRGCTVLTSLPEDGAPPAPQRADAQPLISPHYGLYTGGKTLTERQVNLGLLIQKTHNVIIIHHYQTWADADLFPIAFAQAYAAKHGGETVADGLSKRLYPLANNTWSAYYRMVETGFPAHYTGAVSGGDADGLDLEPHAEPSRWVKEFFLVDPANVDRFLRAYEHDSYASSRQVVGHRGVTAITSIPALSGAGRQTPHSKIVYPLGGSPDFFLPHPGMLLDGTIRTDESINLSSMFRNTFSIVTYQALATGADPLTTSMNAIYAQQHNGASRVEQVKKTMFPMARNHWDMVYRMIETSFTPEPPESGTSVKK
jgi:hypothetical protein